MTLTSGVHLLTYLLPRVDQRGLISHSAAGNPVKQNGRILDQFRRNFILSENPRMK